MWTETPSNRWKWRANAEKSRAKRVNSRESPMKRRTQSMEVAGGCREVARKASELPRKPDSAPRRRKWRAELFFQVQRVVQRSFLFGEQVAAIVLIGGDFMGTFSTISSP